MFQNLTTIAAVALLLTTAARGDQPGADALKSYYSRPSDASGLYQKAFELLEPMPRSLTRNIREVLDNGWVFRNADLEAHITKDRGIVPIVLQAAEIDRCDFLYGRKISSELRLPHLERARRLSQYLVLKAIWYEDQEEFSRAADCFAANRILANHIAQDAVMMAKMMSIAVQKYGDRGMARVVNYPQRARHDLLKRLILISTSRVPLHEVMPTELAFVRNEASRMFDEKFFERRFAGTIGEEDIDVLRRHRLLSDHWVSVWYIHLTTLVYSEVIDATRMPTLTWTMSACMDMMDRYGLDREGHQEVRAVLEKIIRASGVILTELPVDESVVALYTDGLAKEFKVMLGTVMQTVQDIMISDCGSRLEADAVVYRLALEIYRQSTGDYPTRFDDLVPGLLPTLPLDPFDGQPLRYERAGPGYRFYSIGPDLIDSRGGKARDMRGGSGLGDIVYLSP
jgi:hypothetical protein